MGGARKGVGAHTEAQVRSREAHTGQGEENAGEQVNGKIVKKK